jgi:hypothetical protein
MACCATRTWRSCRATISAFAAPKQHVRFSYATKYERIERRAPPGDTGQALKVALDVGASATTASSAAAPTGLTR